MRYQFQNTGSYNISGTNLSNLLVALTSTGTSGVALIGAFRLKRLLLVDTGGNPIYLNWFGNQASGVNYQSEIGLTDVGSFSASRIDSRPPKNSLAAFWVGGANTNIMFTLQGAAETTYVDIWVDFVLSGATRTVTLSGPSAAGNAVYVNALSGNINITAMSTSAVY